MRRSNKEMREDFFLTRKIIYLDENNEFVEMKDNTKKYLYQQWDKNRGIKYVPKNKKGGGKNFK